MDGAETQEARTPGGANTTFHRPPREWPDAPPAEELRIHAPPTKPEKQTGGLMQAAFPAMGSVGLIGFALISKNPLFIYLGVALVCVSILFVVGLRWSQTRSVEKRRQRNRRRYRSYLSSLEKDLSAAATAQLNEAERLYPDHERLWGLVMARRNLWERRAHDPDFLRVRLGRGPVAHSRPIRLELGDDPLAERERDLEDEAGTVRKRWQRVNDMTTTVDLAHIGVMTIAGAPEAGRALARSVISQLAAFRAPGDVCVMGAFPVERTAEWEWMKWLPHARGQPRPTADGSWDRPLLLADSAEKLARLLDGELSPRIEQLQRISEQGVAGQGLALDAPRLVLVIDGFVPDGELARLASLRDAMGDGRRLETTVILLCDGPENEPSEIDVRMTLTQAAATIEERGGEERVRTEGVWPDAGDLGLCEALARSLAPLRLENRDEGAQSMQGDIRLLDLLGLPSSAVDTTLTWRDRPDRERLRVPLGRSADGELLALDLKEAAQGGLGPHGLIVGATGSGKSELLRTMVAGLAATHSPQDLSFALIDYKGGSAFAELARLPHTAGLITNLQRDTTLVDRMRDALLGEQERRQSMLRDAGDLDDIGAYRRAREQDPSLPAMPNLLVIVDEFGELLAAQPDFIDLFLGIGRVGRSLGIHLLLSTQRLDEGRLRGLDSHLRYRICLRTYSAAESKVVLGNPDAYLLPSLPGSAYLKVDTSVYERFKVALVSGAEPDAESAAAAREPRVEVFASAPSGGGSTDADGEVRAGGPRELDGVIAALERAPATGSVHQVWAPPLEADIDLDAVAAAVPAWWERGASESLSVPLGLVDKPLEQRREPLVLDFAGAHGHLAVVGAPQSGKTSLLRALVISMARTHTPAEARVHAIDFGGGHLGSLGASPNVGTICSKAQPDEVRQTVRHLRALVARRQELLARLGISSITRAREERADIDEDLADVFLLVDGWSVLRSDFEGLDIELEGLAAEGLNYGVHLVVTANRWGEIRPHLRDNLGGRLELRLNDPLDSELGRRVAETVPEDAPGRGLTAAGLHFQVATPSTELLETVAQRWTGPPAAPVPVLPPEVDLDALPALPGFGVSLGVEGTELAPVSFDCSGTDPHFVVFGDGGCGKTNLLRSFAHQLSDREVALTIVDYRRGLLEMATGHDAVRAYAASHPAASEAIAGLTAELAPRLPQADAMPGELTAGRSWEGPRHVLIVDDYDLVPSAMDNPLAPITDYLAIGADIGFHLVMARRVGGLATASFEGVLKRLLELRPSGMVMNGAASEGPVLGGLRASPQPPGRGRLVLREADMGPVQSALVAEPARSGSPAA